MRHFFSLLSLILYCNITSAQTIYYTYDSLNRITHITYPDSSIIMYAYDPAGNRVRRTEIKSTIVKACPQNEVTFYAGTSNPESDYQWQVDTLNGFEDVIDGPIYSGSQSSTLILDAPPTNWYNNKYRCRITDSNGQTYSETFTLKFEVNWTGDVDTAWENSDNWNCGQIPDEYTDVYIPAIAKNYAEINSNAHCRSISLQVKTSLTIHPLNTLVVSGLEH